MGKNVQAITAYPVRGGVEMRAMKKSARGSKFIFDSIVVLYAEKSKQEIAAEMAAATEELLKRD